MYETMVVGFDDSQSSRAALIEASNMAKRNGGKVILVHAVFFDSEEFGIAPEQLEKRLKIGEKACIQSQEMVSSEFGVDVQSLLCQGDPPDVILDIAEGKKADLIVLGTHGRRGLNRLLMGSVTSRIILDAPMDVLVVKKPCTKCTGEYKSILVPFDGSDFSKRALHRACQVAREHDGEVNVIYVIPRYEEMLGFFRTDSIRKSLMQEATKITDSAKELASLEGSVIKTTITEGYSSDKIIEAAKEAGHDLIVMGSHGYRGVNKAIMGSTAERVIIDASCPVLIVR